MRARLLALLSVVLALVSTVSAGLQSTPAPGELFVIELPAGNVEGFSIEFPSWSGHVTKYRSSSGSPWEPGAVVAPGSDWRDRGFAGVLFKGKGRGVTHLRARPGSDATVMVDRHAGVVRFEDLTLHPGPRQGIFFGAHHPGAPVLPEFRLELERVHVVADAPAPGSAHSTVWPLFGYQADVRFVNVRGDSRFSAEHFFYWRGFARDGISWKGVTVTASGAQGLKVRNSPTECSFVPGASIRVSDSSFAEWYQPHTWRGGGGIVLEGAGCDLVVERTIFYGGGALEGGSFQDVPASQRTRAIMVDDAQGDFYSATTGARGTGFATGHVVIRNCGLGAGPGTENLSPVIRVGGLGSTADSRYVARSVRIEGNGIFGERLQLQLSNVPPGKLFVRGNNSPQLIGYASRWAADVDGDGDLERFNVQAEAVIATSPKPTPLSKVTIPTLATAPVSR